MYITDIVWWGYTLFVVALIVTRDLIKDKGMIPVTAGCEPNQPAPQAALGVCQQDVSSL